MKRTQPAPTEMITGTRDSTGRSHGRSSRPSQPITVPLSAVDRLDRPKVIATRTSRPIKIKRLDNVLTTMFSFFSA